MLSLRPLRSRARHVDHPARRHPLRAAVAAIAALGLLAGGVTAAAHAAEISSALVIDKTVDKTVVSSGDSAVWEIELGCESLETWCWDAELTDVIPAPFELASANDVTVIGALSAPDITVSNNTLSVKFTETNPNEPGKVGLKDGQKVTLRVTTKLPADAAESDLGKEVINTADAKASNAQPKQASAKTSTRFVTTADLAIDKTWTHKQQQAGSAETNTATITVKNTSNVGATSLSILDPAPTTPNPFDVIELVSLGATVLPEGATRVAVTVTDAQGTKTSSPASATATLPAGVAPGDIAAIEFLFSGDSPEAVVAGGSAGSIELVTKQRSSVPVDSQTTVNNTAQGSVVAPSGSTVKQDSDAFVITPQQVKVSADKSFSPDGTDVNKLIWVNGSTSTVTLSATNQSNVPLKSLTVTEPAGSPSPTLDDNKLDFTGFTADHAWPQGATAANITFHYADSTTSSAQLVAGDALPAPTSGKVVTGFVITYTGVIEPGAKATIPFQVTTRADTPTAERLSNTVRVDGVGVNDIDAAPAEKTAQLVVSKPTIDAVGKKTLLPKEISGAIGQQVVATLTSTVDGNVPANTVEIIDPAPGAAAPTLWDRFDAKKLVDTPVPAGATLTVFDDEGALLDTFIGANDKRIDLDLPAGITGIKLVYTYSDGVRKGSVAAANLLFEAKAPSTVGDTLVNCMETTATATKATDEAPSRACDKVAVTTGADGGPLSILDVSSTKKWTPQGLWIPQTGAYPTSTLSFEATNRSPIASEKLSVVEPTGGTTPFNYVTITKIAAITVPNTAQGADTHVRIPKAGGGYVFDQKGDGAIAAAKALSAQDLVDAVGIEVFTAGKIRLGQKITVDVTTQLRETTRDGAIPINAATAALVDRQINNQITATVEDARDQKNSTSEAPLTVRPIADQPLSGKLSKNITPDSDTILSANPDRVMTTTLAMTTDDPETRPTAIEIIDTDKRFWNAFELAEIVSVDGVSDNNNDNFTARIDFLSGATFSSDSGNLNTIGGVWVQGTAFNLVDGQKPDASTLPQGVELKDVQGIRVVYLAKDGQVFPHGQDRTIGFTVKPLETLRSGDPMTPTSAPDPMPGEASPGTVTNVVTGSVSNTVRTVAADEAQKQVIFTPGVLAYNVEKKPGSVPLVPGVKQNFELTAKNTGSVPIVNPVFTDVVPLDADGAPQLIYNKGEFGLPILSAVPSTASITVNPDEVTVEVGPTGEVSIRFPQGTRLMPGESYTVRLPLAVAAGTPPTGADELVNTFRLTGDNGVDKSATAKIRVDEGAAYWRTKDVREVVPAGVAPTGVINTANEARACVDDGGFYRTPCLVQTKPGGTEEWRVRIANTGNLPATEIIVVDVLPHAGDKGTSAALSSLSRGSEWAPTLTQIPTWITEAAPGSTITWEHQTAANDQCVFAAGGDSTDPWGATCADWEAGLPGDLSSVTAFRVKVSFPGASPLMPGEEIGFTYQTKSAKKTSPGGKEVNSPAWNSIVATTVTDKGEGVLAYETLEPNKAGVAISKPIYKVAVGDYVWLDWNRDGLQDSGEPAVPGVSVILYNEQGTEVAVTTTDADGLYLFDDLEPGVYSVEFRLTPEQEIKYGFTGMNAGPTGSDSDADPTTGKTAKFLLEEPSADAPRMIDADQYPAQKVTAQFVDPTIDAGLLPKEVTVGDYVWFDTDGDGLQDDGEPGIPGVALELLGPDGKPLTVNARGKAIEPIVTNDDGFYVFPNLPTLAPGETYTVRILKDDPRTIAALVNYAPTLAGAGDNPEKDSSDWQAATIKPLGAHGEEDFSLDFGFVYAPAFVTVHKVTDGPAPADVTYTVELACTAPNGSVLDPKTVTLAGGATSAPIEVTAGVSCVVTETDTHGAKFETDMPGNTVVVPPNTSSTPAKVEVTNTFPDIAFTKALAGTPTPVTGEPGTYDVSYTLSVTETKGVATSYQLSDSFRFGAGVSIVEGSAAVTAPAEAQDSLVAGFDGTTQQAIAKDVPLAASSTHLYTVSVRVVIDPKIADAPGAAHCDADSSEGGAGGLNNIAGVTWPFGEKPGDACLPVGGVTMVKTLSDSEPIGAGRWKVSYDIEVTNTSSKTTAPDARYTLNDVFRFGSKTEADLTTVVVTTDSGATVDTAFDGSVNTTIVKDVPIATAKKHVYTVTVEVEVPLSFGETSTEWDEASCDAADESTDVALNNRATLISGNVEIHDTACAPLPSFRIAKKVSSAPVASGTGSWDITYQVTAHNDGAIAGSYLPSDVLQFGTGIVVQGVKVTSDTVDAALLNQSWNGTSTVGLTTDPITLDAGAAVHFYVTATVTLDPATATAETLVCPDSASAENSGGLLNRATLTHNGLETDAFDCADLPKPKLPGLDKKVLLAGETVVSPPAVADTLYVGGNPRPRSVRIGDTVRYLLTVSADAQYGAADVAVADNLPAGLKYDGVYTADQGEYANGVWTIGTLRPGQTVTLVIDARISAGGDGTVITNVAQLSVKGEKVSDNPEDNPGKNGGRNTGTTDGYDEVDLIVVVDLPRTGNDLLSTMMLLGAAASATFAGLALVIRRRPRPLR